MVEESIFLTMLSGPRLLTTMLVVKPSISSKHLPKVLKKLTQEGFQIVGLRQEVLGREKIACLLPVSGNEALRQLHVDHMTSGPSLVLCLQRENAVKKLLDILGPADPHDARRQSQFLMRSSLGADPVVNGFHGKMLRTALIWNAKNLLYSS